jgi:diaminopimelate decarboxylase
VTAIVDALSAQDVFPDTAAVAKSGHLVIGGCDMVELAERYGTPLYVYDAASIRSRIAAS